MYYILAYICWHMIYPHTNFLYARYACMYIQSIGSTILQIQSWKWDFCAICRNINHFHYYKTIVKATDLFYDIFCSYCKFLFLHTTHHRPKGETTCHSSWWLLRELPIKVAELHCGPPLFMQHTVSTFFMSQGWGVLFWATFR